jgi:two-component system, NtrC family, sensor kinase
VEGGFLAWLSAVPVVAPGAAAGRAASRWRLTLRAKGVIALFALIAYVAFVALYVTHERSRLLDMVRQFEAAHQKNELLTKINTALTHSIVALQALLNADNVSPRWNDIELDVVAFAQNLPELERTYPDTGAIIARLQRHFADLGNGQSRGTLIALRDGEQELAAQLERFEGEVQGRVELLSREYRELNHSITVVVTAMNLLGLALFGTAVTLFFTRLSADLRKLEARAAAVVGGYRGDPLQVTRNDEVGRLMEAVNRMQGELGERERQQEMSRRQRFHQEKMAAVGSLAAAVAHEISNPLNSISGIAQYTMETIRGGQRLDDRTLYGNSELELKQAERIGSIVRQLADLSAPRSPEPELLHVNELVESTCSFIRYDKRFRHIDLVSDLDRDLPAVCAVADHLTQVLMNLLINAADAMEGMVDRKPTIRVSTRRADGQIVLLVSDNGHGMKPDVLTHAFDQCFTTKPAGKGRGIGLYLCKTLIEEIRGTVQLRSAPGAGTTAEVRLPCGALAA